MCLLHSLELKRRCKTGYKEHQFIRLISSQGYTTAHARVPRQGFHHTASVQQQILETTKYFYCFLANHEVQIRNTYLETDTECILK
jgi:hypothetical protein